MMWNFYYKIINESIIEFYIFKFDINFWRKKKDFNVNDLMCYVLYIGIKCF